MPASLISHLVANVLAGAYVPGAGRALGAGDDLEPQLRPGHGMHSRTACEGRVPVSCR